MRFLRGLQLFLIALSLVACGSNAAPTRPRSPRPRRGHRPRPSKNIPADACDQQRMVIVADGSDPVRDGVVVIKQDRSTAVGRSNSSRFSRGGRVGRRHWRHDPHAGIVNAHVHGGSLPGDSPQ